MPQPSSSGLDTPWAADQQTLRESWAACRLWPWWAGSNSTGHRLVTAAISPGDTRDSRPWSGGRIPASLICGCGSWASRPFWAPARITWDPVCLASPAGPVGSPWGTAGPAGEQVADAPAGSRRFDTPGDVCRRRGGLGAEETRERRPAQLEAEGMGGTGCGDVGALTHRTGA